MALGKSLPSLLMKLTFSATLVLTTFATPSPRLNDASQSAAPTITTSSGTYQGGLNQSQNVEYFKGVRYGQPPVGNLRFSAPLAASTPSNSSDGGVQVQDATVFGNACPQLVRTSLATLAPPFCERHNALTSSVLIALGRRFHNFIRQPITRSGYCRRLSIS